MPPVLIDLSLDTELSLRDEDRRFSLATMNVTSGFFHRKQKENITRRNS